MPQQVDVTNNEDYQSISYRVFQAVDHTRYMSWERGTGQVVVGPGAVDNMDTTVNAKDMLLDSGKTVIVMKMYFKLAETPS